MLDFWGVIIFILSANFTTSTKYFCDRKGVHGYVMKQKSNLTNHKFTAHNILIPGSSLCIKFVPKFTKNNLPKGIMFTYLEDPGINREWSSTH